MRLQIASDLHLENLRQTPAFGGLVPGVCDVLVLAGDIHRGSAGIRTFAEWPTPVVYVPGNHEFYGHSMRELEREMIDRARGTNVHVMLNREVVHGKVRFIGCTLWTDFRLNRSHRKSMQHARSSWDCKSIGYLEGRQFSPDDALVEHCSSVRWLSGVLSKPFDGYTVIVTHHAPSRDSLDAAHSRTYAAASFASDLSSLAGRADIWIHGHVHRSSAYRLCGCQVLCNPRGRPIAQSANAITGSNRNFRRDFTYKIGVTA